ncbi:30S ribosomal protein S4 [Candidatus Uhrbacteria bacterium]|nr:30S ribosomal protein S4 [Candidatus Uhrbacteria bacterium]MBD3283997.1 30S ribosomal protein S4 [Candidatus Uhrbacteria bacterium]
MKVKLTAKMSRREGVNLDGREKIDRILNKRPYIPGEHGPNNRARLTDYAKQLREKQKCKRIYGLTEKQFRNLFEESAKKRGDSGSVFVTLLESRLDNVIFRAGFAKTRAMARQYVGHAMFDVNGKKMNIPSYRVKEGDVIRVRANKQNKGPWKQLEETVKNHDLPSWIATDPKEMTIKVTGGPSEEELKKQPFDIKLIVEFYSR